MTIEQMKAYACECFNIPKDSLNKQCRKAEVVYAKVALSNVLYSKGYTSSEIGSILGLTHAAILHHLSTLKDRLEYDPEFRRGYEKFNENV